MRGSAGLASQARGTHASNASARTRATRAPHSERRERMAVHTTALGRFLLFCALRAGIPLARRWSPCSHAGRGAAHDGDSIAQSHPAGVSGSPRDRIDPSSGETVVVARRTGRIRGVQRAAGRRLPPAHQRCLFVGCGASAAFQTETHGAEKPLTGRSAFQVGPTAPSNELAGAVRRLLRC